MSREPSTVSGWLNGIQAGEPGAAEKLWQRYYTRLVRLARENIRGLPRREADEEDIALSAFDSFCRGAERGRFPDLRDRNNLWRLLVTITSRKAHHFGLRLRRRKRGGGTVLDEAAMANLADSGGGSLGLEQLLSQEPTPEFAAQAAEEYQRLLTILPHADLRAVAQWKMEGYTNAEIAAKLGCVARSVERKLGIIRAAWEKEGIL